MRNLKEIVKPRMKAKKLTIEMISSLIGMEKSSYVIAINRNDMKLKNFSELIKVLEIEPNFFFGWGGENSAISVESEPIKTEKEVILESEVKFLRDQIKTMNEIIKELSKTKN